MRDDLGHIEIADVSGLFAIRQAGRQVGAALHLDPHDQVRVATTLSELGRDLYSRFGDVSVAFGLERGEEPALVIDLGFGPRPGADIAGEGTAAAERLMDRVEQHTAGDRLLVRARKNLPASAAHLTGPGLADLRAGLWRLRSVSALDELRTRNAELIDSLEEAQRRSEELRRLNTELEQSNQGVMALYTELSEELEKTNQGVVALYAELDEMTDRLREAAEAKNRFWASISHELRTPVNTIIGLARLLLDPAAGPLGDEQREQVSLVCDTGTTLLGLVNELLDMAKAERGYLEPNLAPVRTADLMKQISALMAPIAGQKAVTLAVDSAGAPPVLVTDEVLLMRILRNLLANGLKFTDEGEVRLTIRSAPDHLEFVVTDTGRGIPHAELGNVFEEFYQVPGPRTEGTGLGLPYARRLARILGGDLVLDSTVGAGTTATLLLPPAEKPGG
ncbi:ATP-binding protein [Actinomadura welshii]